MSELNKLSRMLTEIIKESQDKGTKAYDTPAEVVRIEERIAWVHIPGGVDETPVKMTIDASPGDSVQVRVADGRAWITGNTSAPPTDDKLADEAKNIAKTAEAAAYKAQSDIDAQRNFFWHAADGAHVSNIEEDATTGHNVLITSDGMAVRDGETNIAFFSDPTIIGRTDGNHIVIRGSDITFADGSSVLMTLMPTSDPEEEEPDPNMAIGGNFAINNDNNKYSTFTLNHPANGRSSIVFKNTTNNAKGFIEAYNGGVNGEQLVISPGGNLIIGGGEYGRNRYRLDLEDSVGERTYIGADSNLYIETNGNNIEERKTWTFRYDGNITSPEGGLINGKDITRLVDYYTTNTTSAQIGQSTENRVVIRTNGTSFNETGLIAHNGNINLYDYTSKEQIWRINITKGDVINISTINNNLANAKNKTDKIVLASGIESVNFGDANNTKNVYLWGNTTNKVAVGAYNNTDKKRYNFGVRDNLIFLGNQTDGTTEWSIGIDNGDSINVSTLNNIARSTENRVSAGDVTPKYAPSLAAHDILSFTGIFAGHVTNSGKSIDFFIPTPKSCVGVALDKSDYVQGITIDNFSVRGPDGYVGGSQYIPLDLGPGSPYTATVTMRAYGISVRVSNSVAWTNVTNNRPVSVQGTINFYVTT